ncbi:MAG: hypothetical protein AAB579_00805 [Patescibacteria group bacterium]
MQEDIILGKLTQHDKRFDEHDRRFDEHDKKFDVLVDKLGNHEERLVRIEDKLDKVENRVFNVEQDVKDIKKTMATKDDLRQLRNDYLVSQDHIIKKLDDMHQEQVAFNHAFIRHEEKLETHDKQIKELQLKTT